MLETEFFPTPAEVIEQMVEALRQQKMRGSNVPRRYFEGTLPYRNKSKILDPSAGSGAILDYLKEKYKVSRNDLLAAEINFDLRMALQGKQYKLIATDWLEYDEPMTFGLIMMNPPFSEGCKHVLKAWEHLEDEGDLVALLNAETVRNPCHKEREVLNALIEKHGNVKFLGSCFKDSERPTNVEIAMICLKKPKSNFSLDFESASFEMDSEVSPEEFQANPLAHANVLEDLVSRYEAVRRVIVERHQMQSKIDFYLNGIAAPVYDESQYYKDREKNAEALHNEVSLNDQLTVLKSRFWRTVFEKTQLEKKATSKFRNEFEKFAVSQSTMAFTVDNVQALLEMFFLNSEQIMKDCLLDTFDQMTKYFEHTDQWGEGWKTNRGWVVNKRIIVPWGVTHDSRWGSWSTNSRIQSFLDDLDKVLCWLDGTKYEEIEKGYRTLDDFVHEHRRKGISYDSKFRSTHFEMRMFKKGTLHIDFLDLELLKRFNKAAAEGRGWLGGKGY